MSESKVVSLRLKDRQIEQLDRLAQREGRSRDEMAARLLEIALRVAAFPCVEFKDFGRGLEPFVVGTRLRVFWVELLLRDYEGDTEKVAEHYSVPESIIKAVQKYLSAFPEEIEAAIQEHYRGFDDLPNRIPNLEVFTVDLSTADAPAP
ncbi:MAG: hypothetical protein U0893_20320 [Chloroflexota bacterium]